MIRTANAPQGAERVASLPYGKANARCARCRTTLRVRVETNGNGGLVDLVEPCPTCAPRENRIRVKEPEQARRRRERLRLQQALRRKGATTLENPCKRCGEVFSQPRRHGRPFSICPSCRAADA